MYCLKCGKETTESQVFCDACLQSMESYPIKPGTAVHLPHRGEPAAVRKQAHRKRSLTPEEQVVQLKGMVKRLIVALAVLSVVLCLATGMLVYNLLNEQSTPVVGRNYTIEP